MRAGIAERRWVEKLPYCTACWLRCQRVRHKHDTGVTLDADSLPCQSYAVKGQREARDPQDTRGWSAWSAQHASPATEPRGGDPGRGPAPAETCRRPPR